MRVHSIHVHRPTQHPAQCTHRSIAHVLQECGSDFGEDINPVANPYNNYSTDTLKASGISLMRIWQAFTRGSLTVPISSSSVYSIKFVFLDTRASCDMCRHLPSSRTSMLGLKVIVRRQMSIVLGTAHKPRSVGTIRDSSTAQLSSLFCSAWSVGRLV